MKKRIISTLLAANLCLAMLLSGCSGSVSPAETTSTPTNITTQPAEQTIPSTSETEETEPLTEPQTEPTEIVTEPTQPAETEPVLTVEQQNSINMLNYLAALVTEINASSGSRVYLEDVYLELLNNTDPSMVNAVTLQQYNEILDLLEGYRMTNVKRERLSYLYDQNRAAKLRSAMTSPLSILNVVQSDNALKAVASLLYLAVDSVNSYTAHTSELDMQYLQDTWNLEDEESKNLHNSRTGMFNYLVTITGNYDLPGVITLNEEYVTEFVKWKNSTNINQRIRWLESKFDTYRYFGEYWLALAESYFQNNNPEKCLEAIAEYESLNIAIYRRDYKYANVLPYAIVSAKETMETADYVVFAAKYADLLLKHAGWYDWAKQYFACQTYVELYSITEDETYLQKAYNTALDTAAYLVEEQKALNEEYLAELELKKVGKNDSATVKQQIEEHNEYVEYRTEIRKTELPPVYEPLRLFCELLFGLAEELNISEAEQQYAEAILREHDENDPSHNIFLDRNLDKLYRFDLTGYEFSTDEVSIEFNGKSITLPAQYVSAVSRIILSVGDQTISDWTVDEVNRNKSENIDDFTATFTSEEAKDFKYEDGTIVTIEVFAYEKAEKPLTFSFVVEKGFLNLSTKFVRK